MAKLFHADIEGINTYYQNELSNLMVHNNELQEINRATKDKLYAALLDNDELRKGF